MKAERLRMAVSQVWQTIHGWWLVTAGAVLVALATVVSEQVPVALGAVMVAAVSAITAVLTGRGQSELRQRDEQADARRGRVIDRRVRDLSDPITIGVHPAATMGMGDGNRLPAFVRRDVQDQLEAALAMGGFVLLVGESTAGKSRLAYEVIRDLFPDHRLICPVDGQAIGNALLAADKSRHCILWLDDLERFLGTGGLTVEWVNRLVEGPARHNIILATMRAAEYADYSPRSAHKQDDLDHDERVGRDVIRSATEIQVPRRWSSQELQRARHNQGDPRILDAVQHAGQFGIAEYLASGPQLLADWRSAWSPGSHPRAAALVAAAVDARRAGYHRPLQIQLLNQLHEPYLVARGGPMLHPEPWDEALAWAREPLHATSSLLVEHIPGQLLAFDYLVDVVQADPSAAPILDETWRAAIEHTSPKDATSIGATACHLWRHDIACEAYAKAMTAGDLLAALWHARCTGHLGQDDKAVQLASEAMATICDRHGRDGDDCLIARDVVAGLAGRAGHTRRAVRMLQTIVDDSERLHGRTHERTLGYRHALAHWTGEAGEASTAAALFQTLAEDRAVISGIDDPRTLAVLHEAARWAGESGKPADAVRLLESVVDTQRHVLGTDHHQTLDSTHTLAYWTGMAGDANAAAALCEVVIAGRTRVMGSDHPYTLVARKDQAHWMGVAGDTKRAVLLLEQLAEDSAAALEADHPGTATTLQELERWRMAATQHRLPGTD